MLDAFKSQDLNSDILTFIESHPILNSISSSLNANETFNSSHLSKPIKYIGDVISTNLKIHQSLSSISKSGWKKKKNISCELGKILESEFVWYV